MLKFNLMLLVTALFMTGCSSSKSDYVYKAQPNDPKLEFTADFNGSTIPPINYKLNIDKPDSKRCDDFIEIGYYFPESSIFILASENKQLSAHVPANKMISIKSHYNVAGASSCAAPIVQFMAEEGKEYLVSYKSDNKFCQLEVKDKHTQEAIKTYFVAKYCTR